MSLFAVVLPIFALIFAGWLVRRIGVLGQHATRELNRFVVYLALPALLFKIVADADWHSLWQPGFTAAFGIGTTVVFVLTVLLRLRHHGHLADAALDGLNGGYANTGFIGFPLAVSVFGQAGLTPALLATLITVCALFAVALVLVEFGLQAETRNGSLLATLGKVAGSLARNPLLVAPILGALVLISGQKLPAPAETFLTLLGDAASPCALVTLGVFLADKREGTSPIQVGGVVQLVALKLLLQPLLVWLLATQVFALAPDITRMAVLMATLPTGTGPFMVAEFYRREASTTSMVILASTILSLLTITGYLAWSA